jgi:hypothetical protein
MYRLSLVDLDEAFAAVDGERASDVRLRTRDEHDDEEDSGSGLRLAESARRAAELDDPAERVTRPPGRITLQPPPSDAPSDTLDEVLFRFSCGDFDGALAAAEALMARVPVVIMPRADLRAEPLGYWHLLLLARIDDEALLGDLLVDVPPAEAVRLVCELVERHIIALR